MNIPFTMTDRGLTVFIDGKLCSFATDHPSHYAIRDAIDAGDEALVRELSDVRGHVKSRTLGRVEIRDNSIFLDGREVVGRLVNRILEMVARGSAAVDGYVQFLDNLYNNPSKRAVDELWGFIEACDLPVTSDGHFLAYRFVSSDYMDGYSGSVFNKPAAMMTAEELVKYGEPVVAGAREEVTVQVVDGITTISCPRNMVDEDKDRTCSAGLHFCSYEYLPSYGFGGRKVVVVKINPADVVAIPSDYNNSKGRAASYTVASEIEDWSATRITSYYTNEYEGDDGVDSELDSRMTVEDLNDESSIDDVLDMLDEDFDEDFDEDTPAPVPTPASTSGTLNEVQVANIRALLIHRGDLSLTAIGAAYGVHRETIARIRDGRSWPNVNASSREVWPVRFNT